MRRLPLCPVDVQRVARSAPCCAASVVRWLHGVDGNAGTDKLIRAALLELDLHPVRQDPLAAVDRETAQLECTGAEFVAAAQAAIEPRSDEELADICAEFGAGHQPHKRLSGESPNMGQPGDARFCLPGLDDSTSPTPGTPAERSAPFVPPPTLDEVAELVAPYVRPARAKRCRVTCELPDGTTAPADEQPGHWWEPRPEEGAP